LCAFTIINGTGLPITLFGRCYGAEAGKKKRSERFNIMFVQVMTISFDRDCLPIHQGGREKKHVEKNKTST